MNAKLNISSRPFWDINMEELDPENHKEFIVTTYLPFYGNDELKVVIDT